MGSYWDLQLDVHLVQSLGTQKGNLKDELMGLQKGC